MAFPGATDAEVDALTFPKNNCSWLTILRNFVIPFQLVPKLTRNFVKEGYMEKTGPRVSKSAAACLYMCTAVTSPPRLIYFTLLIYPAQQKPLTISPPQKTKNRFFSVNFLKLDFSLKKLFAKFFDFFHDFFVNYRKQPVLYSTSNQHSFLFLLVDYFLSLLLQVNWRVQLNCVQLVMQP